MRSSRRRVHPAAAFLLPAFAFFRRTRNLDLDERLLIRGSPARRRRHAPSSGRAPISERRSIMMRLLACGAILAAAIPASAGAQDTEPATTEIVGHVLQPQKLEPTAERMSKLKLPENFKHRGLRPRLGKPAHARGLRRKRALRDAPVGWRRHHAQGRGRRRQGRRAGDGRQPAGMHGIAFDGAECSSQL